MILFFLLIVHVWACAVITIIKMKEYVPGSIYMIGIMWLIPFAGIALFFVDEYVQEYVPEKRRGYRNIKDNTFEESEFEIDADRDADMIVPIEEALVEGDEKIRRKLMFKLLDSKGADNIRLIKRLAAADDREIAHFASTSLMEYRRSHEQKIADVAKKLNDKNLDRVTLEQYCGLLKEYLESGILPPAILGTYRQEMIKSYEQLIKIAPRNMDHREIYLQVLMESGDKNANIKEIVEETLKAFPSEMRSYQLAAEYSYLQNSREGIDKVLDMVSENHIYLNLSGKKWFSFWKGKE